MIGSTSSGADTNGSCHLHADHEGRLRQRTERCRDEVSGDRKRWRVGTPAYLGVRWSA
jgi:hypothetical protein